MPSIVLLNWADPPVGWPACPLACRLGVDLSSPFPAQEVLPRDLEPRSPAVRVQHLLPTSHDEDRWVVFVHARCLPRLQRPVSPGKASGSGAMSCAQVSFTRLPRGGRSSAPVRDAQRYLSPKGEPAVAGGQPVQKVPSKRKVRPDAFPGDTEKPANPAKVKDRAGPLTAPLGPDQSSTTSSKTGAMDPRR